MTFYTRLNAIERAFVVAGLGADRCGTCGAPDPYGRRVILLEPGEEPESCPACDEPVDDNGRAIGPRFKVIVLS